MTTVPLLLGHTLEGILNQVPSEHIEPILDHFASRQGAHARNVLIQGLNLHMVHLAQQEHIDAKAFEQLRIQVVAACSLLAAMTQHGEMYIQGVHPHPAFQPPPNQEVDAEQTEE